MYVHERAELPEASAVELLDEYTVPESPPVDSLYPVFGLADDLMLGILKPAFEPVGVRVLTQHEVGVPLPLILVRATRATAQTGFYPDDTRFVRSARVAISTVVDGPEADVHSGQLVEAVQHVLMRAWREQVVVPGAGSINNIRAWVEPVRVTDFQTATNIVQYPSLPRGAVRFEQNFNIVIRPDSQRAGNPFVTNVKE